MSLSVLSADVKRGNHTGEKSHSVFPVKTPNLQTEVNKWFLKAVESVYLLSFYLTLGIGSLPSLLSCCFQSHSETNSNTSPSLLSKTPPRRDSNWFWLTVGNSLWPQAPPLQRLCRQQTHHSSTFTALPALCALHRSLSGPHLLGRNGMFLSTSP